MNVEGSVFNNLRNMIFVYKCIYDKLIRTLYTGLISILQHCINIIEIQYKITISILYIIGKYTKNIAL